MFILCYFKIYLISCFLYSGSTGLIHGPRNTVVSVGERMKMKCQADSSSTVREWSMQRPFTSNPETIFKNWKDRKNINNPHFGIVEDVNGSIILYTNSTEMDDAGIYTCTVQKIGSQPDRYSAQLIVFGKQSAIKSLFSNETKFKEL